MASGALQISAFLSLKPSSGSAPRRVPAFASQPLRHHALPRPPPTWKSANLRSRSTVIRSSGGSDQAGGGDRGDYKSKPVEALNWTKPILSFVGDNFLPIVLVSGVMLGLADPTYGCFAHSLQLSKFSTFGIFIISGLTLRSDEIGAAAEAWPAGLFGLISILVLSPFLSQFILRFKLVPREFVNGLAIFFCMPTTLSSGIALTNLMKGNSALALAMTVISNLSGILLVPFLLSKFIGQGVGVSIPVIPLLKSLTITLLVPLILGKVLRDSLSNVAQYVDQNRRYFSYASSILLSLVPWMQVSRSRSLLLTVDHANFVIVVLLGMVLHAFLLVFNAFALWSISAASNDKNSVFLKKQNARAVIIVASQKTLPVMVAVVEKLGGAFGDSALLLLPCVSVHINQIIIDSFLANYWIQKDKLHADTQ